jgi:ribosomal protein L11 methyltransferase
MAWVEISIEVEAAAAETVAAYLSLRGALIEVRDQETLAPATVGRVELHVHVAPERAATEERAIEELLQSLAPVVPGVAGFVLRRSELIDDSWRDAWKRFFRAQRVGRRFLVRPSWDQVPLAPDDRVIELDPGRAFGTGAHASTRLCLLALERLEAEGLRPTRTLDLGCGSGILTVAALRMWPGARATVLDIDPEAVATARENAERNGVVDSLRFITGDLGDAASGYDLVLANIQREVLEAGVGPVSAAVGPGGRLILAGLLEHEDEGIANLYRARGFEVTGTLVEDEWRAVLLRRV